MLCPVKPLEKIFPSFVSIKTEPFEDAYETNYDDENETNYDDTTNESKFDETFFRVTKTHLREYLIKHCFKTFERRSFYKGASFTFILTFFQRCFYLTRRFLFHSINTDLKT